MFVFVVIIVATYCRESNSIDNVLVSNLRIFRNEIRSTSLHFFEKNPETYFLFIEAMTTFAD